jgi:hypothetical protein
LRSRSNSGAARHTSFRLAPVRTTPHRRAERVTELACRLPHQRKFAVVELAFTLARFRINRVFGEPAPDCPGITAPSGIIEKLRNRRPEPRRIHGRAALDHCLDSLDNIGAVMLAI